MAIKICIRRAELFDADAISQVIILALKETNSKDYNSLLIEEIKKNFTPDRVIELINKRQVFVATTAEKDNVIGTASLEGDAIRSVFVSPNMQRKNIGTMLMGYLENIAKEQNIRCLTVPSSVTAERFYLKLGYKALRDEYYGEERTIIMEKHI